MAQSITIPLLTVPNLEPHRSPTKRINSLDDVTKPAPELKREYLTVDQSPFATGAFSNVFAGRYAPPECPEGVEVAVKVLRIGGQVTDPGPASENKKYEKYLGREVFVWQRLQHPRINPLIGYIREYKDGVVPCIVTKKRPGNLLEYLERNPEANRLQLLCQAVEGLIYLHTLQPYPIIHLDPKPDNILVTDEGDAELCDFGYSKVLGGGPTGFTTSPNPGGTYPYMSPEVLLGEEWQDLTPAADIFGLGSTIIYVLSGQTAWCSIKAKGTLMMKVVGGVSPAREEYPMDGSKEAIDTLWDLLVRCWSPDPSCRPSSQEALNTLLAIEAMGGVRPPRHSEIPSPTAGDAGNKLPPSATPNNVNYSIVQPGVKLNEMVDELKGKLVRPATTLTGGGHADVYKGQWIGPDHKTTEVAIKVLRVKCASMTTDREELRRTIDIRMKREALIWARAKHRHIHTFLGFKLGDEPQLISPWCAHGTLIDYLTRNKDLSQHRKLMLIYQAALGLAHLHGQNPPICHADIKPENVLVNDSLEAVLTDFGLSRVLESLGEHTGLTTGDAVNGTDRYTAPELFNPDNENRKPRPTRESDVYAFGGLILRVMSGEIPFHGSKGKSFIVKVMRNKTPEPKDHKQIAESNPLWLLMNSCWRFNPSDRPPMIRVLESINKITLYRD